MLTSVILLIAEYLTSTEVDGKTWTVVILSACSNCCRFDCIQQSKQRNSVPDFYGYIVQENSPRNISYTDKQVLEASIVHRYSACVIVDEYSGELPEPPISTGVLQSPVAKQAQELQKRKGHDRTL